MLSGCGKSTEEKVIDSIDQANTLLTTKKCDEAITVLEGIGRQTSNPRYIVSLASAYACKAGYSSVTFFSQDLGRITQDDSTFGGLAAMSTSDDAVTPDFYTDTKVTSLLKAINVLLYAGGGIASNEEPTYSKRLEIYGNESGDVNSYAVYLLLAYLGKFYHYFGDASVDTSSSTNNAVKAGGSLPGTCMTSYTNAEDIISAGSDVDTYLSNSNTGSCDSVSGSTIRSELNAGAANRRALLCQAIVGFNNLLELIPLVIADATETDLSNISDISNSISAAKTQLTNLFNAGAGASDQAALAATIISQNQTLCESSTTINIKSLEAYFLLLVESTFK